MGRTCMGDFVGWEMVALTTWDIVGRAQLHWAERLKVPQWERGKRGCGPFSKVRNDA